MASLFSTKSLHVGRVIDFILPVPRMLICSTHGCFLVSTISPCDLCLHYKPRLQGAMTLIRDCNEHMKLSHGSRPERLYSSSPIGDICVVHHVVSGVKYQTPKGHVPA